MVLRGQSIDPAKGGPLQSGTDGDGAHGCLRPSYTARGPAPASASAAPSDSASQCNYRTREEVGVNGPQSSQASVNIPSGLGGRPAHPGPGGVYLPLGHVNSHNPSAKGRRPHKQRTPPAHVRRHDGKISDGIPQRCEPGTSFPRVTYDFNLLSPYELRHEQEPELLENSSGDCSPIVSARNHRQSQQHAVPVPPPSLAQSYSHREHLQAGVPCQQSQIFQMTPSLMGAQALHHAHLQEAHQ